MVNFNYVITDEIGIHARPAGFLQKKQRLYLQGLLLKLMERRLMHQSLWQLWVLE